ncbi:MAG: deoxyribose-phosphate aldolase [Lachnospiraceae bacterium]|nr:deoxyribose-phosphate aldolase [Lachnospiraceae bacterium]
MTNAELYSHVDHTQLKPYATWKEIVKLCDEAIKFRTASVCVPPSFIKKIKETYKESLDICTVIGFPLGYSTTEVKVKETLEAIKDGADEIDMVINIGDVKNGDYDKVLAEIKAVKNACKNKILKVIVETCYLDENEKIKMCEIVTEAGADYIKTSTGFGTGGATFDDVKLFKEHIGQNVKIKAAGGIRTKEDMETFLSLGADRLGTSSAVSILEG